MNSLFYYDTTYLLRTYIHLPIQYYINAIQRNLPPFGR